jgi:hypothetical protein
VRRIVQDVLKGTRLPFNVIRASAARREEADIRGATSLLHLTLPSLILGLAAVAALPAFAASAAIGDFRDAVEVDGR